MSDEPPVYALDVDYIWEGYPNGIEGAHSCIAMSLASIIQAESFELTGIDDEAYFQIITNHVIMLKPAPLREIAKKEKK